MPFALLHQKVVAHKVIIRQVTIISFSPVIQIKLYIFIQQNNREKSSISTFEKQIKESNTYCIAKVLYRVYTVSTTPSKSESTDDLN